MPQPVVVFPDATAVAISYVRAQLAARDETASVVKNVPDPRPDKFVTIRRGGGPRRDLVTDRAQLLVECWAPTDEQAHDLAQLVRALLHAMAGTTVDGTPVYRVDEFAGLADLPDPTSLQPRVVFTLLVHVRGAAA